LIHFYKSFSDKKKMGEKSSDNWVFDSLVGFLRGPVWNVPILTFIENKSLVFEPAEFEQNQDEYKKIHEDYKNLVDFMLGSYMEDIGISHTQFQEVVNQGNGKIKKSKFRQGLFEQVWAADDFEIFKQIMIQKNIELQLQALELLQQRYGVLPLSLQPGGKNEKTNLDDEEDGDENENQTEDKVMLEVARQSKEDHEAHVAALNKEDAELEQVLAHSLEEHKRLATEKLTQEHLLAEHFKTVDLSSEPSGAGVLDFATPLSFPSTEQIDPEELAKRTAFLRSQRDKLLAMKKIEREKQLTLAEKNVMKTRPKSARAARSAMRGSSTRHTIDPKTLEVRRALAEKLKQEVIGED